MGRVDDPEGPAVRADDDTPPTGETATAQRAAPYVPLVWIVLGLVAAIGFVLLLTGRGRFEAHPGAAPVVAASRAG